ncbi:hypothetical protein NDU88_000944 [Pleurodeles waltl]|uniref:Uncharacterized protein n=1 Tax=Pleurodeles waltl TaxID=8319 RepID=A0AAV7P2H8_PLEWA|nr:hypothetical protein NDU88_000944 [Pleurodeles waltl]
MRRINTKKLIEVPYDHEIRERDKYFIYLNMEESTWLILVYILMWTLLLELYSDNYCTVSQVLGGSW